MSKRTRLSDIKNFGPVTLPEFQAMGFQYVEDLEKLGFEEVCRTWIQNFPDRLNANAFLGVIATIEGVVWVNATPSMRAAARNLAKQLRVEYGLQRTPKKRKAKPARSSE